MAYIQMKHSYKRYKTGDLEIIANNDVSFEIEKGELVVVLGASGAGKSTVLNILGGMDTNDEGRVIIDGKDISEYSARELTTYRRENVGFVFQFYNLVSNLTARENVELASEIVPNAKDASQTLVEVGLGDRLDNFPSQLSGGEQQRVGIVRAMIGEPKILLMDEPFSALDAISRKQLQTLTKNLHKEFGMTTIFVTHDTDEALKLGDRIAVLQDGEIRQVAEPETILQAPATDFVANLFGGSPHV